MATAAGAIVSTIQAASAGELITAGVAVAGTAAEISNQSKSRNASRKANRAQAKIANIEQARSRRATIAQARKLRAQTIAQGEAQGVSGGSATQGAAASITSQGASAVNLSDQLQTLEQERFHQTRRSGSFQGRAATARGVSSFVDTTYNSFKDVT